MALRPRPPRSRARRAAARRTVPLLVAVPLLGGPGVPAAATDVPDTSGAPGTTAAASADRTLVVDGRGYGHGRGLGQYGSLGYAVDHGWDWRRITDHYYGGTRAGTGGSGTMTVRLLGLDGAGTIVLQERGRLTTTAPAAGPQGPAVRVERVGPSRFAVFDGPSCAGPWTRRSADATGASVRLSPTAPSEAREDALQVCEHGGVRWVRGDVLAVDDAGTQRTVNSLPTEQYLRGVVPRESPAGWGDLGGGRGMDALRAQAVAARSYAEAESRYPYARTCDSTACQVYGGMARQTAAGFVPLEDPRTDRAIADTAGQVRLTATGRVARTEFSSSTGGWTAGGTFPAVEDLGDATTRNPNRQWRVAVPFSRVEAAWPGRGALQSAQVASRSGPGPDGGRALTVRLRFTGGEVTATGEEFRSKLGLKSSWVVLSGAEERTAAAAVAGWVLDRHGGVHPVGGAPAMAVGPWWPWGDVAARLAVGPGGAGVVLDRSGGLHPVAPGGVAAPVLTGPRPYWPGWSVARDVVLLPGRSDAGYVLDAFGGVHPFGGAPAARTTGYWAGWDIARGIVLLPGGEGGYVLDGLGGLHPFATGSAPLPGPAGTSGYGSGVAAVARAAGGGWVLDAAGRLHSYGGAPALPLTAVLDRPVGAATTPDGTGSVLVVDGAGRVAAGAPGASAARSDALFGRGDIARDVALRG